MKNNIIFMLMMILLNCGQVSLGKIELAREGESTYGIVVPYHAQRSLWAVAQDLAAILEEMTGATFPVYTDQFPASGTEIIMGRDNQRLVDSAFAEMATDFTGGDYEICHIGQNVVIVGGPERGTINGIYGFCQDQLGCRWLTPGCQYIPRQATVVLEKDRDRRKPAFLWRSADSAMQWDAHWVVRNRFSESKAWAGGPRPGAIMQQEGDPRTLGMMNSWNPHAFQDIPESVYQEHPEWRAEVNGQRNYIGNPVRRSFCMTNEKFIRWVARWVKEQIQQEPHLHYYSITNADNDTLCQCASCRALTEKVGGSGCYISFVNQVAEQVAKDVPQARLITLAYHHTFAPQPVQVHPNVRIVWAPIPADYAWALDQGEVNQARDYVGQLEQWKEKSPSLGVWLYQYNLGAMTPRPTLRAAQRSLQILRDKGVDQVFIEMAFNFCYKGSRDGDGDKSLPGYACAEDYYRPGGGYGTYFFPYGMEHLRGYIYARLLWNPDEELDRLMEEFCFLYYGPAGAELTSFSQAMEELPNYDQSRGGVFDDFAGVHMSLDDSPRLKLSVLHEFDSLMEKALEKTQGNPLYRRRVEIARMGVDLALIGHDQAAPESQQQAAARFQKTADEIQLLSDIRISGVGMMKLPQWKEYAQTKYGIK